MSWQWSTVGVPITGDCMQDDKDKTGTYLQYLCETDNIGTNSNVKTTFVTQGLSLLAQADTHTQGAMWHGVCLSHYRATQTRGAMWHGVFTSHYRATQTRWAMWHWVCTSHYRVEQTEGTSPSIFTGWQKTKKHPPSKNLMIRHFNTGYSIFGFIQYLNSLWLTRATIPASNRRVYRAWKDNSKSQKSIVQDGKLTREIQYNSVLQLGTSGKGTVNVTHQCSQLPDMITVDSSLNCTQFTFYKRTWKGQGREHQVQENI